MFIFVASLPRLINPWFIRTKNIPLLITAPQPRANASSQQAADCMSVCLGCARHVSLTNRLSSCWWFISAAHVAHVDVMSPTIMSATWANPSCTTRASTWISGSTIATARTLALHPAIGEHPFWLALLCGSCWSQPDLLLHRWLN